MTLTHKGKMHFLDEGWVVLLQTDITWGYTRTSDGLYYRIGRHTPELRDRGRASRYVRDIPFKEILTKEEFNAKYPNSRLPKD